MGLSQVKRSPPASLSNLQPTPTSTPHPFPPRRAAPGVLRALRLTGCESRGLFYLACTEESAGPSLRLRAAHGRRLLEDSREGWV